MGLPGLTRPLTVSTLVAGCLWTGSAWAAGPQELAEASHPQGIYGGTEVAACGWPTTVSMEGSCTATLVHPQVVIFAAHCGGGYNQIWMGEDINNPTRTLKPEFCRTFSGNQSGTDFAFCKLSEPVLDVPIVPVLMGCETELLQPGQEVTIVGFGNADNGPYGIKREVTTTINNIQGNEAFIGGNGKDSCQGDSGGPVYIKLADGTWRVFGITSYGGQCGTGGFYSLMHNGMQWFEQESGIDITPCHNSDGTWQPGAGCLQFPTDPGPGGGSWPSCGGGALSSGPSMTCGAPQAPDTTPPTLTIVDPVDGQEFMGDGGAQVKVIVDAQDIGWGIKEVQLLVNGEAIPGGLDQFAPYEFPLKFPSGGYCLGATGVDFGGNPAEAEEVCIGVNQPAPVPEPPPPPATTGESESGSEGEGGGEGDSEGLPTTGDTEQPPTTSAGEPTTLSGGFTSATATDTGPGEDEGDEGCGCRSGHAPGDSLLALAGLGLLALTRRRRR